MNGPDAIHARFADAVVPSAKLPELREALTKVRAGITAAEVTALIRRLCDRASWAPLRRCSPKSTAGSRTTGWKTSSAALRSDGSNWRCDAKNAEREIRRAVGGDAKTTAAGAGITLVEECLVREYRAALEVFASDDFREGVRAAVIDKDRNPTWSPPRIEDVTPTWSRLLRRNRRRRVEI